MMITGLTSAVLGTWLMLSLSPVCSAFEAGSQAEERRSAWSFTPDPALPNVLILGDSISIGYTLRVRELLRGKANIFRPLTADGGKALNCEGTKLSVGKLDEWLAGRPWAVIHANWGLHDLKRVKPPGADATTPLEYQTSLTAYDKNLRRIMEKLKATGARVVFATTTPVPAGVDNPPRDPADVLRYNAAALYVMRELDVPTSDLYNLCLPRLGGLQQPRNVHFTDAGSNVLALAVAACIERELAASHKLAGTERR